jgi:hypothetical protein
VQLPCDYRLETTLGKQLHFCLLLLLQSTAGTIRKVVRTMKSTAAAAAAAAAAAEAMRSGQDQATWYYELQGRPGLLRLV